MGERRPPQPLPLIPDSGCTALLDQYHTISNPESGINKCGLGCFHTDHAGWIDDDAQRIDFLQSLLHGAFLCLVRHHHHRNCLRMLADLLYHAGDADFVFPQNSGNLCENGRLVQLDPKSFRAGN